MFCQWTSSNICAFVCELSHFLSFSVYMRIWVLNEHLCHRNKKSYKAQSLFFYFFIKQIYIMYNLWYMQKYTIINNIPCKIAQSWAIKVHVPDTHNRYSDTKTNRVLDTFIKQSHNLSVKFGAHTCIGTACKSYFSHCQCYILLFLFLSLILPLPRWHSGQMDTSSSGSPL